jgi:hypothetical protein
MRKDLYRVTTYDEFAEHTKAAVANQARGLRGRDPTPMVHFVAGDEVSLIAAFFDSDHPERRRELVDGFVLPLIRERGASAVAFSFAGTRVTTYRGHEDRLDVMTVVTMDREVQQAWVAALADLAVGALAPWELLPPNQQVGQLVTPIQEALR